jgi:hypothetical protein
MDDFVTTSFRMGNLLDAGGPESPPVVPRLSAADACGANNPANTIIHLEIFRN